MRTYTALLFAVLLAPAGAGDGAAPVGPPRLLDPTGRPSTAIAINNLGAVAGWHVAEDGDNYHAFVWTEQTGLRDIGTLGGASSVALDINDRGEVIGWATLPDFSVRGFIWTQSTGMRELTPAAFAPRAINNAGVIAGALNGQAVLRIPDGTFIPLGTASGAGNVALDVNDRGEAVGAVMVATASSFVTHPFYWSAETGLIDIHEPGTSRGAATRINNQGTVVGYLAPDVNNLQSTVYTWTRDGGTVDIGNYPGGLIDGTDYGNVFGINGLDQVVATSTFPGDEITRQLLWSGGTGPFVIAEAGIPDLSHMGINDVGEIAGSAGDGNTAAVWATVLTDEQQAASLRALVEDLVLRRALRDQDAHVLLRKADDKNKFAKHVAALVRSGRLTADDGWLLSRAILVHASATSAARQ